MSVSLETLTKEKASQKVIIEDLTNRVTRLTGSMLAKEDLIKQLEGTIREVESKPSNCGEYFSTSARIITSVTNRTPAIHYAD